MKQLATLSRRAIITWFVSFVVAMAALVVGCNNTNTNINSRLAPEVRTDGIDKNILPHWILAPTGTLRIGVYKGSPSSLVVDKAGNNAGVAHDAGLALAKHLGVPAQVVTFDRLALVLDALKAGQVDMTFTNASPARQREFAFTQPMLSLELGYLVPASGKLQTIEMADTAAMRIGVSQGSSSQAALGGLFKQAKLTAFANLELAKDALRKGEIDGFATNKGILNELLDDVNKGGQQNQPAFKILSGRWGLEHMGMAIPKERAAALPFVQSFGDALKASGDLDAMAARAGLRGLTKDKQ